MLLCVYSELVYNFKAVYTYSSFKRIKSIYKKTVKIVKINQVLYKIEGIHIFKKKKMYLRVYLRKLNIVFCNIY